MSILKRERIPLDAIVLCIQLAMTQQVRRQLSQKSFLYSYSLVYGRTVRVQWQWDRLSQTGFKDRKTEDRQREVDHRLGSRQPTQAGMKQSGSQAVRYTCRHSLAIAVILYASTSNNMCFIEDTNTPQARNWNENARQVGQHSRAWQNNAWHDKTCKSWQSNAWHDKTCRSWHSNAWHDKTCRLRQNNAFHGKTCRSWQSSAWHDTTVVTMQLCRSWHSIAWHDKTCRPWQNNARHGRTMQVMAE